VTPPVSVVTEAVTAIAEALATVDGLQVYTDPGATVHTPGAVIGPPALTWSTYGNTGGPVPPASATFLIYVCTTENDQALVDLLDLMPFVAAALDTYQQAASMSAQPGQFVSGGTPLPCYTITLEVGLS
jgi:hypothetical protein